LLIPLPGAFRQPELMPNSEQNVENKFVTRHIAKPHVSGCFSFLQLYYFT
jgi:hypothetical protein